MVLLEPGAPNDSAPTWDTEFTRPVIRPQGNNLPGQKTIVIPLQAGPSSLAGRISLGRSSICDVALPFPTLSKVHAYLTEAAGNVWRLEDAGSLNGTLF